MAWTLWREVLCDKPFPVKTQYMSPQPRQKATADQSMDTTKDRAAELMSFIWVILSGIWVKDYLQAQK